jgi:hypothetical protein
MHDPTIIEWARFYAQKGWKLLPVHGFSREKGCTCPDGPSCTNAGKHPSSKNGLKDATDVDFIIDTFFGKGNRNIGLACGAPSGVWVLDIDGPEGRAALKVLEEKHGRIPPTLTSETGRGAHLFFNAPPGVRIKSTVKKVGKNIDVRGDGGYVILPPSHHMSGVKYKFLDPRAPIADAPEWLLSEVTVTNPAEVAKADVSIIGIKDCMPGSYRHGVLKSMLDAISPDTNYDEWFRIGMAVKAAGGGFSLWDEWSARGEKYVAAEMVAKWNSFRAEGGVGEGTLAQIAEANGWTEAGGVDLDAIIKNAAHSHPDPSDDFDADAPAERPRLGVAPAEIPGMIGKTVDWILRTSMQPQPELALCATLAAVAGVVGRKYRTKYDTRCNLYVCGLAPTGAGKDHARKKIRELFYDACLSEDHLGKEEFISAPGALNAIEMQPSQVMLIDEIGAMFQSLSGATTASFKKDVVTLLMKAFSSSGSKDFSGGVYADRKRDAPVIDYPSLSIYGTSTETSYAESLTDDLVHDGSLNRWLIIPAPNELPLRNFDFGLADTPDDLRDMWMALKAAGRPPETGTDITSYTTPVGVRPPILVEFDADASAKMLEIWAEQDGNRTEAQTAKGSLYARMAEQTIKLAMLFAICRKPSAPSISVDDLRIGRSITLTSINYTIWLVHNKMSNTEYERLYKAVLDYIRDAGTNGRSKTDVCRRFRVHKARDRDDVLASLAEENAISKDVTENAGRYGTRFFAVIRPLALTLVK